MLYTYCIRYGTMGIFLLLSLLLLACARGPEAQGQEEGPIVQAEQRFGLAVADSVLFQDGTTRFWIQLYQIQDNRCPLEVNCITGGKASVVLHLNIQPEVLQFCLGSDCREQQNSSLLEYNNERYTIVLEEVSPYPQQEGEQKPKQAIFKIKRTTG
jgi:hypothetical protein